MAEALQLQAEQEAREKALQAQRKAEEARLKMEQEIKRQEEEENRKKIELEEISSKAEAAAWVQRQKAA